MELKAVKELPKKATAGRPSKYEKLIEDFLKSGKDLMEVTLGPNDPKPNTVIQRLNAAKKKMNAKVRVRKRGDRIFLERI